MLKIDNSLLQEIGLDSLPDADKNGLLKHIYETLEMRVGMRLADQMTNEQLDEFERYFEAKDDAGAFKWLETNFPNYKEIVQQEFDKLKVEVAQTAPQILASSQQAAAQQAQALPPQQSQPQPSVAPSAPPLAPQPQQPYTNNTPSPAPSDYSQPPSPVAQMAQPLPQPQYPAPPPMPVQPIPLPPAPAQPQLSPYPYSDQPSYRPPSQSEPGPQPLTQPSRQPWPDQDQNSGQAQPPQPA